MRNTGRTHFKKGHIPWNNGKALGLYGTSFYKSWVNMKTRCSNPNSKDNYKRYGARGIQVCPEWEPFEGFYKDMFPSYEIGLTLDRINNNDGYFKENCRWATRKEQANNTRIIEKALRYSYEGVEDTVKNWAGFFGIKRTTLDARLRVYKWSIEKALFTPVKGGI